MSYRIKRISRSISNHLRIRPQWRAVFLLAAIVTLIALAGRQVQRQAAMQAQSVPSLDWRITEVDGMTKLLKNDISDSTAPDYTYDSSVNSPLPLTKDASGNLPTLFRYQGELRYSQ